MAEVVIIGAGLAGLNAARTLLEHGVDVEVFEATERVGGRAHTCRESGVELPIELGPEFVHGDPDETRRLVRDPSIEIVGTRDCHHVLKGRELVARNDVWKRFGELLSRADQRADESARAYMQRVRMAPDDAELFANFVEGFYGADLDKIDIASVAEDEGGANGDAEASGYYLRNGYASVVDSLAAQIPRERIHLSCPVTSVDWQTGRIRVELEKHDTVIAHRVIVAVPLGVLQAGTITLDPALHETAIKALAMGHVTKVVVRLREPLWEAHDKSRLDFVHGATFGFPTYWMRSRGDTHLLTAWAGGKHARALHGLSTDALLEAALDGFAAATRIDRAQLASMVVGRYHHDWSSDPYTRGAYSYMPIGADHPIAELAKPVEGRMFFAGEMTDEDYEGTVVGALRSGLRAAEQILRITRASKVKAS